MKLWHSIGVIINLCFIMHLTQCSEKRPVSATISPSDAGTVINLHLAQSLLNDNKAANSLQAEQVTEVKQSQVNNNNAGKPSFNVLNSIGIWISQHKFLLMVSTLCIGYAYLRKSINAFNNYLRDPSRWSAWKAHLTLEQLMADPIHTQELLRDVQLKHINTAAIADIYSPITSFFITLSEEENLINQFLKNANRLKKWRLARFFPYSKETIQDAHDCLKRLRYLRTMPVAFFAHHNYEQIMQIMSHKFLIRQATWRTNS